jgi:transposase
MSRKLEESVIEEIKGLFFDQGLSISEIRSRLEISHYTAYVYTKAFERGFKSPAEYKEYRARKNGHSSRGDYIKHLEKLRKETIYERYKKSVKKRGFKSVHEYHEFLAKQKGFESHNEYYRYLGSRKKKIQKLSKIRFKGSNLEYVLNSQETIALRILMNENSDNSDGTSKSRNSIERMFRLRLGTIARRIDTNIDIDVKSDEEYVFYLTPRNLESRAFLDALVLSSGLTDRIIY